MSGSKNNLYMTKERKFENFITKHFLSDPRIEVRNDGNQRVIFENGKIKFGYSNFMPNIKDDILHEICHIILCEDSELKFLYFEENIDGDLEFAVHALSNRIHELAKYTQSKLDLEADQFSLLCGHPTFNDYDFRVTKAKYKDMFKYSSIGQIVTSYNHKIDLAFSEVGSWNR